MVYSQTGTYIGDIVPARSGELCNPWDVVLGPDGNLYVSDNANYKIRKYSGTTGSPMGSTSTTTNAEWVSPIGFPNGLVWNDNTLYVTTGRGVEHFSLSGTSLGYFGDAQRNPSNTQTSGLTSPHDVIFCPDNCIYVTDRGLNAIFYQD